MICRGTACAHAMIVTMAALNHSGAEKRRHAMSAEGPANLPEQASIARELPPPGRHFPIAAIGASAGGLEAASRLFDGLPANSGMAFILVQHLDPTHESMLVELLAEHGAMKVVQANDGALLEPDHVYVIPPGRYLSVRSGALHLTPPQTRHGARLPFDVLIKSLAQDCGPRTACLILSGTGADGSLGLPALKTNGGFIIAQDPDEADFDGMPRSAILTGLVDAVLPLDRMPEALAEFGKRVAALPDHPEPVEQRPASAGLSEIIAFLQENTAHDFRLYKPGTLERRIERRMGLAAIKVGDMPSYLQLLRDDPHERDLLAKDLLINVTRFFRDPQVFETLEKTVIPDLIRGLKEHQALRIWVPGCSTGEEAYSIAMVCRDAITVARREIKLQVFASDVDPDAITVAREGLYQEAISADMSPDRFARFFRKEDSGGYRVAPDLRADVIFTVQDLLADPPFSRIDLVSCRNLLIYFSPDAQAKAIALFHFALREHGILLLGPSETAGNSDGGFELIAKTEKIYRHIGRSRPGDRGFPLSFGESMPTLAATIGTQLPSRQTTLADLCRQAVIETHAPAAVLINRQRQCLYSLGPTDRFLRVAPGYPSHDLLAMATPALRTKLRLAIEKTGKDRPRVSAGRTRMSRDGATIWFDIDVQLLTSEGEELLLVCFIEETGRERRPGSTLARVDRSRIADLDLELEATQAELQTALKNLEMSTQEQKAINEEALSVNEEFQSTNEELLTSKEELQSLNEELSALNTQLQETLDRQRTTADDLQNVLFSTNVATLFLDRELKIRFFTPATRSLFNVIPGDVGRPLADLHPLAADEELLIDAKRVLAGEDFVERQIQTQNGIWFMRRILPYLAHDNSVEGVVITFVDITERKLAVAAVDAARQEAERANVAKSRFLAAASHDLRQPLQSLTLLQALMAQVIEGEDARKLLSRFDQTLGAMSGMLNALLDINQIEAGVITARPVAFPIAELLDRLRDEFTYLAQARHLSLHVLPSSAIVESDPRLLEQMIRNLLANAVKYTRHGKILLGCRRNGDGLRIEVWDCGIGIAEDQIHAIFDEFHQVDNVARERRHGLGLGLSIVQRLAALLGHEVSVRSLPGKGSVFSIGVKRSTGGSHIASAPPGDAPEAEKPVCHGCEIILIEDDPDVLDLLAQLLRAKGHMVKTAPDGETALKLVSAGAIRPDIILADYNLPNGMNGLQLLAKIREMLHHPVPGIILTGDISTRFLAEIALQDCVQLSKPVQPPELASAIERLLPADEHAGHIEAAIGADPASTVFVVDDDPEICASIRDVLEADGRNVEVFGSAEAFLAGYLPGGEGCMLIDANLPGLSGIALLEKLRERGDRLPAIIITGSGEIGLAVQAMKAGACDFIEKPVGRLELLASIGGALEQSHDDSALSGAQQAASRRLAALTKRQHQIMDMVLLGHPSKNIAADLGISQRTVENHRASIMHKTGAKSLPELARLAFAAPSARL